MYGYGSLAEEFVNNLKKQILSVIFASTSGCKMSLIVKTVLQKVRLKKIKYSLMKMMFLKYAIDPT